MVQETPLDRGAEHFGLGTGVERVLPIAARFFFCHDPTTDQVELLAPAGTPIHAIGDGRVVEADAAQVGEVVIRLNDNTHAHYRLLAPSSVAVRAGDHVGCGVLVGAIAPIDERVGTAARFTFGLRAANGEWLDPFRCLAGATDPAQLGIPAVAHLAQASSASRVIAVEASRTLRSDSRRAAVPPVRTRPTRPRASIPAVPESGDLAPPAEPSAPAAAVAPPTGKPRADAGRPARPEPDPALARRPPAAATAEPDDDTPTDGLPAEGPAPDSSSKLASRRPRPRRS